MSTAYQTDIDPGQQVAQVESVGLGQRIVWRRTGLELPSDLDFGEWQALGSTLDRIEAGAQWWFGDWWNYGERCYGELSSQELDPFGAYGTRRNAAWVASRIELSRRRDSLSFGHHQAVAPLEPDEQEFFLDQAEPTTPDGPPALTMRELRAVIRDWRRGDTGAAPLPDGVYRVLYVDPPWQYNDELIEGYGAAEHHYPTMGVDELGALADEQGRSVYDLAADDSVLFLWSTSPMLPDALKLIDAWGFSYKSSFVWDKVKHNYGHYNSVRHEFLLVATRGSCVPDTKQLFDSVQVIERTDRHSEKPEEFRRIIDTLYPPNGRVDRVELFRRGPALDQWHVWGNEVAGR